MVNEKKELDAVIIGAGFSGMYMLHLLRQKGYSVRLYDGGSNVGGTWYYNRYPGARCDVQTEFYCYTFSEEIHKDWNWSSIYPEQSEILDYCNYVADKLDLRRDIQFNTRINNATYDEKNCKWEIDAGNGETVFAKYLIPAIGNVSLSHEPNIPGLEKFKGEKYHTSQWPQDGVDFTGKRVAVIGTGSSGVQSITDIAKEAEHLTVFQRTAQYVFPVNNRAITPDESKQQKNNFTKLRQQIREHFVGVPAYQIERNYSALEDTVEERQHFYEELWNKADGLRILFSYNDIMLNDEANDTLAEFVRSKIKGIVKDQETAENLLPSYLIGGKRPVIATNYYETYNQENVSLVNLKKTPFVECTEKGLRTTDSDHEVDVIVFASGFDAMTGPLKKMNIRGRNDATLKEKWQDGHNLKTYLGICHEGFPNMFTITGPHFPLTTNALPINELMAEWIIDCITYVDQQGAGEVEVSNEAEEEWTKHVNEVGEASIYAKVDSWYTGANIEGKPRAFYGYTGDFVTFQEKYKESRDYSGLILDKLESTID